MHIKRLVFVFTLSALLSGCDGCVDPLSTPQPRLLVEPDEVNLDNIPITQDTVVSITVSNPSSVPLLVESFFLRQPDTEAGDVDPAFTLLSEGAFEVASQGTKIIRVNIHPNVVSKLVAELVINATDDAVPTSVVVPFTVQSADLGVPDIDVQPPAVDFGRIGQNDVTRTIIDVGNIGARDLLISASRIEPADSPFRVVTSLGQPVVPGDTVSVELLFRPTDTVPQSATLFIDSNDPDEPSVAIPLTGQGSECPVAVAEFVDSTDELEPLDTIRVDGRSSEAVTVGTTITEYEWTLGVRPPGSTAALVPGDQERSQITCDVAGDYAIRLQVTDSDNVRSCNDALIEFSCIPTEDLHMQLVWDHPTADFDLHLLQENGTLFTHETDTYFSNRSPEWFDDFPESNPELELDDSEGYGPENTIIVTPFPGSRWQVNVHYWNAQTAGDPFAIATLRIYARGQLISSLQQSFDSDEQMWSVAEIVWPLDDTTLPTINPINAVEAYPRPF